MIDSNGNVTAAVIGVGGEFAREKNVAKFGATIGFHGSEALCRLQIAEIQRGTLMGPHSTGVGS
jgi:hypothetical protein